MYRNSLRVAAQSVGKSVSEQATSIKTTVTELAALLSRAYLRFLVAESEEAHNVAVSAPQNPPNTLADWRPEWPPVARGNPRGARP